ncbi:MAG: hypothetical protein V2A54_08350 [Bacteroidota bacterium]
MAEIFSFIENTQVTVLSKIPSIVPGIEKSVAIFYDEQSDSLNALSLSKHNTDQIPEAIDLAGSIASLQELRSMSNSFHWYGKSEIPFEIHEPSRKEITLFTELEHLVLLVRVRNIHDNQFDLYFIYFTDNMSALGIGSSYRGLSTEIKNMAGNLLCNTIRTLSDTFQGDRRALSSLTENTRSVISQYEQARERLTKTSASFSQSMVNLARHVIRRISDEEKTEYRFSDSALDKIKTYTGDINLLEIIVSKAALFARTLAFGHDLHEIVVNDWHLNFEVTVMNIRQPDSKPVQLDRYTKTIMLLDKMEKAAQLVLSRQMELTSANVANAFPSPISAPAITDSLKKHRNKILALFTRYPDKWRIIRENFRPVRNILEPKKSSLEKSA